MFPRMWVGQLFLLTEHLTNGILLRGHNLSPPKTPACVPNILQVLSIGAEVAEVGGGAVTGLQSGRICVGALRLHFIICSSKTVTTTFNQS